MRSCSSASIMASSSAPSGHSCPYTNISERAMSTRFQVSARFNCSCGLRCCDLKSAVSIVWSSSWALPSGRSWIRNIVIWKREGDVCQTACWIVQCPIALTKFLFFVHISNSPNRHSAWSMDTSKVFCIVFSRYSLMGSRTWGSPLSDAYLKAFKENLLFTAETTRSNLKTTSMSATWANKNNPHNITKWIN